MLHDVFDAEEDGSQLKPLTPEQDPSLLAPFEHGVVDCCNKGIGLYGRGLELEIDYDDVHHPTVLQQSNRMIAVLNKYWDAPLD